MIPRPAEWSPGPGAAWSRPGAPRPAAITVEQVEVALQRRGEPAPMPAEEMPEVALPGPPRRPAAVVCLLFSEDGQAHVVLTRRSSRLRSHTHQVSFPGGRLDEGESAEEAARREVREEIGIDPATMRIVGRLSQLTTVMNPSPITPFVAVLPGRPVLVPNPAEVERALTVPLLELTYPEVYREELWTFPNGSKHAMTFYELIGDTVWGATARMLAELLDLVVPVALEG